MDWTVDWTLDWTAWDHHQAFTLFSPSHALAQSSGIGIKSTFQSSLNDVG